MLTQPPALLTCGYIPLPVCMDMGPSGMSISLPLHVYLSNIHAPSLPRYSVLHVGMGINTTDMSTSLPLHVYLSTYSCPFSTSLF